ncbi:MAG: hypothetical protein V3T42_09230 [Nitrospirales bacterium]
MKWIEETLYGTVEKVGQRRSRSVVVLTYSVYPSRANGPAALLDRPFGIAPFPPVTSGCFTVSANLTNFLNYSTDRLRIF